MYKVVVTTHYEAGDIEDVEEIYEFKTRDESDAFWLGWESTTKHAKPLVTSSWTEIDQNLGHIGGPPSLRCDTCGG